MPPGLPNAPGIFSLCFIFPAFAIFAYAHRICCSLKIILLHRINNLQVQLIDQDILKPASDLNKDNRRLFPSLHL